MGEEEVREVKVAICVRITPVAQAEGEEEGPFSTVPPTALAATCAGAAAAAARIMTDMTQPVPAEVEEVPISMQMMETAAMVHLAAAVVA